MELSLSTLLTTQANEAFFGPAWHGPSLWPTLKKFLPREALTPSPFEGFTAWGVALHTAYWKHRGGLLLAKASGGAVAWTPRFFRGPSDWPALPASTEGPDYLEDLVRIHEVHDRWVAALAAFPSDRWNQPVRSDGTTAASLAFGVAAHDLYHTAQMRNMGVRRF